MSGLTGMPPPKVQDMFQVVVIDDAVLQHFPKESTLISARPHGASFWTRTACIELEMADKSKCRYFMKIATGNVGLGMLKGECHGVTALYRFVPDVVPRPIAWGTYSADPDTHFYLCEFIDMIEELPDIRRFCAMLAKLHHDSMASKDAPTKFGFPVVTYEGNMYQDVNWCETWEQSFALHMKAFIDQEKGSQGPSEELDELLPSLMEKVIPRLLRPLQTHGRNIKPALLHGDLWYGNMATNKATGNPLMFDPSLLWGHNECEYLDHDKTPVRQGSGSPTASLLAILSLEMGRVARADLISRYSREGSFSRELLDPPGGKERVSTRISMCNRADGK